LAHALQPTHELVCSIGVYLSDVDLTLPVLVKQAWDGAQSGASEPPATTGVNSAQYDVYNIQSSTDSGLAYPPTDSSSSSSSPPETVPKLYIDVDSNLFPNTGVHNASHPFAQTPSTESHRPTPTAGSYSSFNNQDILELHHAMEFHKSGYADRATDMSYVTSSLQAPKLYFQYS
jgi:hypothetical protein